MLVETNAEIFLNLISLKINRCIRQKQKIVLRSAYFFPWREDAWEERVRPVENLELWTHRFEIRGTSSAHLFQDLFFNNFFSKDVFFFYSFLKERMLERDERWGVRDGKGKEQLTTGNFFFLFVLTFPVRPSIFCCISRQLLQSFLRKWKASSLMWSIHHCLPQRSFFFSFTFFFLQR